MVKDHTPEDHAEVEKHSTDTATCASEINAFVASRVDWEESGVSCESVIVGLLRVAAFYYAKNGGFLRERWATRCGRGTYPRKTSQV